MAFGKERIIICADCGASVVTTSGRTLYCRACAKKRNTHHTPVEEELHFCDSPERIQMCLNCEKPDCTNCFGWNGRADKTYTKPDGAHLKDVLDEVVACFKQGIKDATIARKFDVTRHTVYRWKRQLREEGLL